MQLTSMKKKLFTLCYLQNFWRFTNIFSLGGEIQVFTTVPIFARRMWDHKIWGDFICMEKAWLDLIILKHICGILTITNDHQQHQYHHQRIPHFFLYATLYKNRRVDLGQKSYHSVSLCLWEKPKRRIHCHLLRFYFFVDLSHMPPQYPLGSKKGEGVSVFYLIA